MGHQPFAARRKTAAIRAGGRAYLIRDQEVSTFREFVGLIANSQGVSIDGAPALASAVAS